MIGTTPDGWTMNQCIKIAMLGSMDAIVALHFIRFTTVKDMWDALEARFNMQTSTQTAREIADLF